MTPIPQSSIQSRLSNDGTQANQPFYEDVQFMIVSAVVILIGLAMISRACALRRSRCPLSNFFVRRRPYRPHRTMPLSPIRTQHRPAATDQNRRSLGSSYAPGGYGKEPPPVYDTVGAPPRYGDLERTADGRLAVQPSSVNLTIPPPAYRVS
ncbi:hypothetical protein EDD15DRAFT_1620535 [Pisolithus albus]|nr:hypothetical protein EDD15DRAFT_1620535 [Pisolithus albus]